VEAEIQRELSTQMEHIRCCQAIAKAFNTENTEKTKNSEKTEA
jgi:hypothetical protein